MKEPRHDLEEVDCFGCDVGGLEVVSEEANCCCLVVPGALPIGQAKDVEARFAGINSPKNLRLIAHQHSDVLFDEDIDEADIEAGCIKVHLPELYEGTVTFLLISESGGVVCNVPSCVVPPAIVEDIHALFDKMIAFARESTEMDEQALFQLVWKESFTSFLTDVDFLFEWLSDGQGPHSVAMDVFVNMLRQCCRYGAWEFGAYMVNKASECGVEIVSNDQHQTLPFTAESLRATIAPNNNASISAEKHTTDAATSEDGVECDGGGGVTPIVN